MNNIPCGNNIVIDTNIIRYWLNKPSNKLITSQEMDELAIKNKIYISSVSLAEIAEQDNDYPGIYRGCIELYSGKKVKDFIIVNNFPISSKTINDCLKNNNYQNLKNDLISNKKNYLKGFIRYFLFLYLFIFIKVRVSDNNKLDDKAKINAENAAKKIMDFINNKAIKDINALIDNLYYDFSKSSFINTFAEFLILWKCEYFRQCNNISDYNSPLNKNLYNSFIHNDPLLKSISFSSKKPMYHLKEKDISNNNVLQFIENAFNSSEQKLITPIALKYLINLLFRSTNNGYTFELQDLMDMQVLYSLELPKIQIITADQKLSKFLHKINHPSYQFIKSLGLTK
jgi:hypothetical protein